MSESQQTNYQKFRGKCKEMSEALCKERPELTLVRGHYDCPFEGKQAHWWTTEPDGTIVDPTRKQFMSGGIPSFYIPFDGMVECSECGNVKPETEMSFDSNYAFCSHLCHGRFVGVM